MTHNSGYFEHNSAANRKPVNFRSANVMWDRRYYVILVSRIVYKISAIVTLRADAIKTSVAWSVDRA